MKKSRFILRHKTDTVQPRHLEALTGLHVAIVDKSSRMILVEGEQKNLESFIQSNDGWILIPERKEYTIPDPRVRIRS